jgi:hypothetical protein
MAKQPSTFPPPLDKNQWMGVSKKSLDAALEVAYTVASQHHDPKAGFKVEAIYVAGTNPLSEYVVVLGTI